MLTLIDVPTSSKLTVKLAKYCNQYINYPFKLYGEICIFKLVLL